MKAIALPQPGEDGTVQRRLVLEADSHRLFEDDRPPVLEAGTPAGWGCTEWPSISGEVKYTHAHTASLKNLMCFLMRYICGRYDVVMHVTYTQ